MIVINNVDSQKFTFNGVEYFKNFTPVVVGNKIRVLNTYDSSIELTDAPRLYSEFEVEGVVYGNVIDLQTALLPILYTRNTLGGGDFIPLSGTTVGNPVTGDIEFEGFSESKLKSYLEGEGENIIDLTRNDEGVAIMHTRAVDSNTCLLLVNTSNIYYNTTDNNSAGFVSTLDHSLIEPTNKLIYAQRKYVDNQNKIATFTIELIDYLTVDFYAPAQLKINSIEQISSTPSITILVSDDPYTLGDLINTGQKITIISDIVGVVNLKGNYE